MVSLEQVSALLDFLEANPELALGRCTRTKEGRSLAKRLWTECSVLLNSVSSECAQKTPELWRMYYNEYKSKLLKKIKAEKGEIGATGGGPAKKISLTALQERLYTILGRDIGEPLPGVRHNPLSQVEDAFQRPSTNCSIIPDENNSYIIEVPQENEHCVFRPESYLVLDPEDYTGQQLVAMNCTGQQSDLADHMGQHTAETVEHTGQPPVRESLPTEPRRRRRRRRTSPQPATQQDHSMQEASERLEAMEQISAEATREHAKATREQAEATRMLAASIRFAGERLREAITFATQSPPRTRRRYSRILYSSDSE